MLPFNHRLSNFARKLFYIIKCDIVKILSYIVSGPRIGGTPLENEYHPSKMHFKIILKEQKYLEVILKNMYSIYTEIKYETYIFLTNFAMYDIASRDYLIEIGIISELLKTIDYEYLRENKVLIFPLVRLISVLW
jgi:hypothetical protein